MTSMNPTARHKRFFNLARSNAMLSQFTRSRGNKVKIGAVIVKGNFVVSEGYNRLKTHTFQHRSNTVSGYLAPVPNIHAEIDALIRSGRHDLTGAEVFVYREFVDGELANCRPCKSCMDALRKAGVKHIYYTTESGYHYEKISNENCKV